MNITCPIVYMMMRGNVKEKVSKDQHTLYASYEPLLKQSLVIVRTSETENSNEQRSLIKSISKHYSKYGKVEDAKYSINGIDIVNMTHNN